MFLPWVGLGGLCMMLAALSECGCDFNRFNVFMSMYVTHVHVYVHVRIHAVAVVIVSCTQCSRDRLSDADAGRNFRCQS